MKTLPIVLLPIALTLVGTSSLAVGTRSFQLTTIEDFRGGDLAGVSVDSTGKVGAGFVLGSLPVPKASSVWSTLALDDGSVLLGTGSDGKVMRVRGGQVTVAAATGQMAVSTMAVAWGGAVIVGTFPEGKLFKLGTTDKDSAPDVFATIPGVEDIWALAFDPKARVLFAATGPEGKIYRVDEAGRSQVYFDSKQPHLISLALGEDGSLYAGSQGKALLFKVTGPGRATVLHDFNVDDVKGIVVAPLAKGGAVYAIANKYPENSGRFTDSSIGVKRNRQGPPAPQPTRTPQAGHGALYRVRSDGSVERLLDDDDSHFVSVALDDNAMPYVGTGIEGRVYSVDDNHVERLVADTAERQVGGLVLIGKHRFIVGSDPVVFHEIKGVGGPDAIWTSKVLDAGLRARFGRLTWRASGPLDFSTRTGNTSVPDATWSAWSAPLGGPGLATSPPARYTQVRARWARDPAALLQEVTLYFVTDNARAYITSIEAAQRSTTRSLKTGTHASGGELPRPASTVKVSWKVDNPDQDELRYRLSYRREGETDWRNLLKPSEKLTRADYDWETSSLPEGPYRILVEASDELANPPDRVQKHALVSNTVLVDNTPPVFRAAPVMVGRRIRGEVVDGVGPIARIEVAIAGTDEWRPIFPKDGVFDEPVEAFDADISSLVPPGSHLIAIRAYDSAGNSVAANVEAK